ncbi:MAG: hypothetical protein N3G20_12305, partial [Verrucomicrobiae bacterium]|nr:hypothetical protein [Verrucomicrobiae bacterium]
YYEAQGGTVVPGRDQLPGSASDWQTMQSFVAIRNNKSQIVLGSNEVPLMQLGDFNLGKWQRVTRVEKPRVFSWVMNNYWFTNFRAEQEGDFIFSYYLTSGNDTTRSFATRFGWGSRVPLLGRVLPPGKTNANNLPDVFSVARLDLTNLLVIEARPARTNPGVIVLVRELDGKKCVLRPENVHVQVPLRCVDEVDALETLIRENLDLIEFEPYESKFLKLSL